jgi:hypothetical protein
MSDSASVPATMKATAASPGVAIPTVPPNSKPPIDFIAVFNAEVDYIRRLRKAREVRIAEKNKPGTTQDLDGHDIDDASANDFVRRSLTGLAFSGGGIRSATFNLGILQALAKKQVLSKFDYLSTVSGGGYIGSWLVAFTRRFDFKDQPKKFSLVEKALSDQVYEIGKASEEKSIRWLRNYADYLTPQTGVLSGDTGAMAGTWLRNVILNFIVLLLFLLGALFIPQVLVLFTRDAVIPHPLIAFVLGNAMIGVATIFMGLSMVDFISWEDIRGRNWFRRNRAELGVMVPYFLAAWLLNASLWVWPPILHASWYTWAVVGGLLYTGIWSLTVSISERCRRKSDPDCKNRPMVSPGMMILAAAGSGAFGGFVFHLYAELLQTVPRDDVHYWRGMILGTVAVMLLMQFVAVLQLGLLGIDCLDMVREWWARAGGRLIQVMIVWLVVFCIVAVGPLGVRILLSRFPVGLGGAVLAWLASNLTGVFAAKSAKTGGEIKSTSAVMKAVNESRISSWWNSPRVLDLIAKVAPYVFALGLIVLMSTAVHILGGLLLGGTGTLAETRQLWFPAGAWKSLPDAELHNLYWAIQSGSCLSYLLGAVVILTGCAFVLSSRVDINDFSLHHFYRNRLVRCYLGASRLSRRKPQPFTGFDPHDDIHLEKFAEQDYTGPYPILNTSLNATRGGELGFQQRKAKSFIFTPLYCGYDPAAELSEGNAAPGSYMPTSTGRKDKWGNSQGISQGISLGTAMAISGAAASPNMGHYTSSAAAFFMTLFDVRLGWWIGNPRYEKKWESPGPTPALGYLLKELVAQSDEASNYVYLSDGGHFENLAIYELVKRRCRFIMVCDSGADRGYGCGDLMAAIEKCKTDFGVDIKISVSDIKPQKEQCLSVKNYALGSILYGPGDKGVLVYVKSSLPIDDPNAPVESRLAAGVRSYADAHQDFPHQSTADQWFDEVQFEAYRALGEHIGGLVGDAINALPDDQKSAIMRKS